MPTSHEVKQIGYACGFELVGIAPAIPSPDVPYYMNWLERGLAGEMRYLTDRRAHIRTDPRLLLPSARSIICVGKLYNTPYPSDAGPDTGRISRYAWGDDYHDVLRRSLENFAQRLGPEHEYKICVDTAPLLERSYARAAGLGWVGKNTCLINQEQGSWFFLGELLTSLELSPDIAPPNRCGTCTRCIDACPTDAILPQGYELDSRACISYLTIELRGPIPEQFQAQMGNHVFGCDICQEVCPWNRRAPVTGEPGFQPRTSAQPLSELASLTEEAFRTRFQKSAVKRSTYAGFMRNVGIARANRAGVELPTPPGSPQPLSEPDPPPQSRN